MGSTGFQYPMHVSKSRTLSHWTRIQQSLPSEFVSYWTSFRRELSSVPLLIDDLSDFGFLPRRINLYIRHDLSRVYAEFHAVRRHGTGNTDIDSAKMNRKSAIPYLKRLVILDIIARKEMKYIPCIKKRRFFQKMRSEFDCLRFAQLSFVNKSETSLSPAGLRNGGSQ